MVDFTFTLDTIQYFILILVRVSTFVYIAPFFGMNNTPARVKAGFSFFFALILVSVLPERTLDYGGMFGYSVIVIKEGITGLLVGFAANLCNSIVLFAGNMMDMNIGLSMAMEYDPMSRSQVTISGQFYNYVVLLLLLVSGLEGYLVRAFVQTYELVPINGQVFDWNHLMQSAVTFAGELISIAFQITLPMFACIMILNCVLGIMAKVAPQMNMFAVGIQIKLLVGLAAMLLVVVLLPYISDYIYTAMKRMVVLFVQGMY